jgi:type IV secretory pathway TraG/TraD family ATPase VirD4
MTIWKGTPLGFTQDDSPIDYHAGDDGHGNAPCLVQGPPGSMKSMGLIATQLLDDDSGKRSYVVFGDGKGELTKITSKFRSTVSEVKIANYGNVLNIPSHGYNPINSLPEPGEPGFGDECQARAIAMIPPEPNGRNKHFTEGARSAGYFAISRECRRARKKNRPRDISNVREFMLQEPDKLRAAIEELVQTGDYDDRTRAAKFLDKNTEIQNLKSTIEVATSCWTPELRADMARPGGIDFRDGKKRAMSIYFITPTVEMKAKSPYVRMALSDCLRALYTYDGLPTTVIIEEAFVLGYHEEIEQALSILRGYGSRLTIVFQSYQQIKKLYPDTHGLFTSGAVLSFRPGSLEDAKWLVERAGKTIVPVLSAADPSSPGEVGVRPSWQQQVRDRIPLDKMMGMPKGRALVWKPGDEKPRVAWVKGYFDIPKLNKRASPNPYYRNSGHTGAGETGAAASGVGSSSRGKSTSTFALAIAGAIIGLLLLLH